MVTKCVTVHCDKCCVWVQGREGQHLTPLRKAIEAEGWTRDWTTLKNGAALDLCPRCSKEVNDGTPIVTKRKG